MKMHREMIKRYTRHLTSGMGVAEDDPMADLAQFDRDIHSMAAQARSEGNLDWLRLSLDALVANPGDRLRLFADFVYPFTEAELRTLFAYAFQQTWPDQELSEPGEEADLDFVGMSDEEWDAIINPEEMF